MTLMLVSVTRPKDAALALAGGADIIDLGDAPAEMVGATVAAIAGRRPVSAAAEPADILRCPPGAIPASANALAILTGADPAQIPRLAAAGFAGALLDTGERRLLAEITPAALRSFAEACHAHSLQAGFAGALEAPDVPRLLVLEPDILGFAFTLGADALQEIRGLIPQQGADTAEGVDYSLLAARGHPIDPTLTDRIFVSDLIVEARVGAYARERTTPQRIRCAVEAVVIRPPRQIRDMRDVVSYDLIIDGIRMLVQSGHIALLETMAEQVAAMVLAHPLVVKVNVKLEKLDTGSGIVGVSIERVRAAADTARIRHPIVSGG